MNVLPLFLIGMQAGPPVLVSEVVEPTAKTLRVEIVASLPTTTARDRAIAELLGSAIARGTMAYPRAQLLSMTSRGGQSLTVRAMADHLRVGFSLAPGDLDLAVELCDQIVREALLPAAELQRLIDELPFRAVGTWRQVWFPMQGDVKLVQVSDLKAAYRSVFKPGQVSIGVGGRFVAGEFRRRLGERFERWEVKITPDPRVRFRTEPPAKPIDRHGSSYTLVRIEGAPIKVVATVGNASAAGPQLADATVAMALLGVGKTGALYESVREDLGQSYRQEAGLIPHADGLAPVMAWATTKPDLDAALKKLQERVAAWTEADLEAARTKLERFRELDVPFSTWYFSGERPLGGSLEDRTFMNAYWRLKTGRAWTVPDLKDVTLESVRTLVQSWLKSDNAQIIPGR